MRRPGHPLPKTANRRLLIDRSLAVLTEGHAWLPTRMRDSAEPVLSTRFLGHPALAVRGPDAVRFFHDEADVRRCTEPSGATSTPSARGASRAAQRCPAASGEVQPQAYGPVLGAELQQGAPPAAAAPAVPPAPRAVRAAR
ncbi:hypothetical protein AB7952_32485 [Streptomyces sp. PG2]